MTNPYNIEKMKTTSIKIDREGDIFVACCPILDVYSQGNSEDEAKENLVEAVALFITSCVERGALEAVLRDCLI
jgi:predicted RNase H-like HicB family nuclease